MIRKIIKILKGKVGAPKVVVQGSIIYSAALARADNFLFKSFENIPTKGKEIISFCFLILSPQLGFCFLLRKALMHLWKKSCEY